MKILNRDHSPSFYQLNQDELKNVNGGGGATGGGSDVDPREKSVSILKSWMKVSVDNQDERAGNSN